MATKPTTPGGPAQRRAGEAGWEHAPARGFGRSLEAVTAQLEAINQTLGELPALRAEVAALGRRIDELRGALAGRGGAADDDLGANRDRDPGDAVPPGVAVQAPAPLTPADQAALHELEALAKRGGGPKRRKPRAG